MFHRCQSKEQVEFLYRALLSRMDNGYLIEILEEARINALMDFKMDRDACIDIVSVLNRCGEHSAQDDKQMYWIASKTS